jgi:hypothetical protein
MSARRAAGSIGGSRRQRSSRAWAESDVRETARNSATGIPERVIVMRSPHAARSTTSPPWLRSSLMLTLAMLTTVSRVIPNRACAIRSGWLIALQHRRSRLLHQRRTAVPAVGGATAVHGTT